MKKAYIEPHTEVITIKVQNVMTSTSTLSVGSGMSSGSADSRRGGDWDDED